MSEAFTVTATLSRQETYAPWWGAAFKPIEALVGFLPSYRDSKTGRTNAKQLRVLILAVGLALLVFGGSTAIVVIGGLVMASALVLPVSEVTKSAWRSRLRRLRTRREREVRLPGSIVYDGKRLILREGSPQAGDKKLRRVLVDRDEHRVEHARRGADACLGVRPPSGRKADSIWICTPAADLRAASGGQVDDISDELGDADVDIWAHIAPNDWQKIHDLLNG